MALIFFQQLYSFIQRNIYRFCRMQISCFMTEYLHVKYLDPISCICWEYNKVNSLANLTKSVLKCDPRLSPNRKIGPSLLTTGGRKRSTNHLLNVKESNQPERSKYSIILHKNQFKVIQR